MADEHKEEEVTPKEATHDTDAQPAGGQLGPTPNEPADTPNEPGPGSIEEKLGNARVVIEDIGTLVLDMMEHDYFKGDEEVGVNHAEMKKNIELSYRHLEDARMRLGKVYQAKNGGVSNATR